MPFYIFALRRYATNYPEFDEDYNIKQLILQAILGYSFSWKKYFILATRVHQLSGADDAPSCIVGARVEWSGWVGLDGILSGGQVGPGWSGSNA
jgi:hypothetical protein